MRPDAPDNMHADDPKTTSTKDSGAKPKTDLKPAETPAKSEKKPPREPEVYSRTEVPAKPGTDGKPAADAKPDGRPTADADPFKDKPSEKPLNATPLESEPKGEAPAEKPAAAPKPALEPEVHSRTPVAEDPAIGAPAFGRAPVVDPGEGDSLLPKESRDDLHDRWQALQLRFIDDPQSVARDAGALVEESLEQLRAALSDRKRELDDWHGEGTVDTERLRRVVCDYRELFDNALGH